VGRGVIRKSFLACLVGLGLIAAAGPSAALADELHNFNPWLSLTGGCITYASDPIVDPDCPYPPETPPGGPFLRPTGVATDSHGNLYVASFGTSEQENGRIDVFDAEGHYLTSVAEPNGPRTVAVDSEGYLYVYSVPVGPGALRRYDPTTYNPATGEIAYDPTPTLLRENLSSYAALAVNPEDDHLFVNFGTHDSGGGIGALVEYGSGAEGNPLLDSEVAKLDFDNGGRGLAIDAGRGRLYATDKEGSSLTLVVRVFELGAPHGLIETIDGSTTPEGDFVSERLSVAVDEATGHLFVYAQLSKSRIWELTEKGEYLSTIEHGLESVNQQVIVDNGAESPNGALNPEGRYLWATSWPEGTEGHAFAFGPLKAEAPVIESLSFGEVSETEAELRAEIDPGLLETSYSFEYVSRQQFEETGFAAAQVAGQGVIAAGPLPATVFAEASGLLPDTRYVFRVVATNELGGDEEVGGFRTYPVLSLEACPNDAFRTGLSTSLPDCRAYELVTPPDTNARAPMGLGYNGAYFPSLPASPDGDSTSFRIEGGLIPGTEGSGSLAGDPYLSTRGPGGWSTVGTGGSGAEASAVLPGGRSPDQAYSVWVASGVGPAVLGGDTVYVRHPDGHSELFGQGSLADDPRVQPKLISEDGAHMLFTSSVHLEEDAPPGGKVAIYDRTADGTTHVVSLLPGEVLPPEEHAPSYEGSSLDGRGVAFTVDNTLYLRFDNQETHEIGENVTFEGVAEGGGRVFYLQGGDLKAFDVATESVIEFTETGDVTVVNVSSDVGAAYFVSPTAIATEPNPRGELPEAGKENLYLSREGAIGFVATVTGADVEGEGGGGGGGVEFNGLGLWVDAVGEGRFAIDPSRTTPGGDVLLFQSRAALTDYDSEGTIQVYRYDSVAGELDCVSCNPTEAPAAAGASLQSIGQGIDSPEPNTAYDVVANLSAGGNRAFFQSSEALVAADTDGLQDVYEWEAQGTGSCNEPDGCLYLISSGHSGKVDYLYAASQSGDDVFVWTADLLEASDIDATPSLYDARVGGGFLEETITPICVGESCRPALSPPPALPTPGIPPSGKSGNLPRHCPKGKRAVRRHGKIRCVRKKHRHRHDQRHGARNGGGK